MQEINNNNYLVINLPNNYIQFNYKLKLVLCKLINN